MAKVIGVDPDKDVAVLKIKTDDKVGFLKWKAK